MKIRAIALLIDLLVDHLEAHWDGRAARDPARARDDDRRIIAHARAILQMIQNRIGD